MRVANPIELSQEEFDELTLLSESTNANPRLALRARMVLLAAQGLQNKAIAQELNVGRVQVARWRDRFAELRLAGIQGDATNEVPREMDEAASDKDISARTGGDGGSQSRSIRRLLRREALEARLHDARNRRCIVIQGQAGSGKTTAMQAWRTALQSSDVDVAWCSLSSQDNELTHCLQTIVDGIAEVDPAIVREASLLTGRERADSDVEHWVIALVHGFVGRSRDFVLMVEDMHLLEDPRIFQMFQWLLDYAPAHVHLVLSSRVALPLSLQRLRAQEMLAEFSMHDLRFTLEETSRYLRTWSGTISAADIKALHELTDGWVAGLQLFGLNLQSNRSAVLPSAQLRDAQAFTSYFEREVFTRLSIDGLEMLTRAAISDRICGTLCAELMGSRSDATRIAAKFERFEQDNFFITRIESSDDVVWFRMHPLMRETLLVQLTRRADDMRPELHRIAWKWFDAKGDVNAAVDHAVQAGALAEAADLVQRCGHELLARGEISQLWGLLRLLPRGLVEQRFDLHVLLAYLHMYRRNTDAFERSLTLMQAGEDALDERQRYYLVLLQSAFAVQGDDPDTVDRLMPLVREIPAGSTPLVWSSQINLLSWFYMARGEYDEALGMFENTDNQRGAPRSSLLGKCISALSIARQGKARQAEEILRDVLRVADARGTAFVGVACMAAGVLANILREVNDLGAVRQLLEPRIGLLERVSLPDIVLLAQLALSDALWQDGKRAEANKCIVQLESHAARSKLHRIQAEAMLVRMQRHLLEGETEQAIVKMEQIEALTILYGGPGSTTAKKLRQVAVRAGAEMAVAMQDWPAAERLLVPLEREFETASMELKRAQTLMQLAVVRRAMGRSSEANLHALEAVRIGHRLGLVRSLLDGTSCAPELLGDLLEQEQMGPVLEFYVRRLMSAASMPVRLPAMPKVPSGAHPVQKLSEREYEVLNLLAQAMPNKKIAKLMQVSPDTVKFHLKNIYSKLGVTARYEAVASLRELVERNGDVAAS